MIYTAALITLDLVGTFVFALSGAAVGVKRRLDLFGVLVLAFVASTSGGVLRDITIGATPPAALSDWRYIAVACLAGLIVFVWNPIVSRLRKAILLFDAAGLALFAVSGAQKALAFDLEPFAAILLGALTGIGGGIVRDVLVNEIPTVLRAEIYAIAALAGATVVVVGAQLGYSPVMLTVAGATLCFILRMTALWLRWRLPVANPRESESSAE
jgi:uncharacterized membrane protein YeiH